MKAAEFAHAIYELYPPFRQWEDATLKAWTSTVIGRCGGFDGKVREEAFKSLTRVRHKEKPPQVAVILEHCQEVHRWIEAQSNKGKLTFSPTVQEAFLRDWREDDFANEIALNRKDPLCMQAAKEGWIGTLHSFVRKHRKMPSANQKIGYRKSVKAGELLLSEIEWCKREATDFDEAYAKAVTIDSRSAAHSLVVQVGDAMLKRRSELIDYVLHGVEFRKKPVLHGVVK